MNELKIFEKEEFGSIRTIEEDGKVLFCGTDIAIALGYTNPRKAVRDHAKGGTKRSTPTVSGEQEMTFIPEGDVYRLITHSKLPAAEKFHYFGLGLCHHHHIVYSFNCSISEASKRNRI